MNVVLPEADSSYTKPCTLRFDELLTGIRYLPSLMLTDASASAYPLACDCCSIAAAFFDIAASLLRMRPLMPSSWSDAESRMSP